MKTKLRVKRYPANMVISGDGELLDIPTEGFYEFTEDENMDDIEEQIIATFGNDIENLEDVLRTIRIYVNPISNSTRELHFSDDSWDGIQSGQVVLYDENDTRIEASYSLEEYQVKAVEEAYLLASINEYGWDDEEEAKRFEYTTRPATIDGTKYDNIWQYITLNYKPTFCIDGEVVEINEYKIVF